MKLMRHSIATHLVASLIGGTIMFFAVLIRNSGFTIAAFFLPVLLVVPLAASVATKILRGISNLEKAAATGNESHLVTTRLTEIDLAAEQIRKYAQRWSLAAERSRAKNQEIDWLIEKLDSRSKKDRNVEPSSRLTHLIGSFTNSAESNLEKVEELLHEFQGSFNENTNVLEDQSDIVSKATTYVEQLTVNATGIPDGVSAIHHETLAIAKTTDAIGQQVEKLTTGIKTVETEVESSEFRLRALTDSFREIATIAETIGEISARTDMLALNVSLEAVRAGHNSRGFSVLAEEVRKLSEQTAQAAREVAGLVDSIQFKTQESIKGFGQQKSKLGFAVEQSSNILQSVSLIHETATKTDKNLTDVSHATEQQIKLIHDLVGSVERLSESTRLGRRRLEASSWGIGNLVKATEQLKEVFSPFKSVEFQSQPIACTTKTDEFESELNDESVVLV